jgi:peptidoglycan/LPS O-acetylase OafA/YrhL
MKSFPLSCHMKQKEPKNFPALTGLRALAAFLVFFFHYNPFARFGESGFFFRLVNEWHIGVSLFFVLSGFLIFHSFSHSFSSLSAYFIKRFARIFPLFFLLSLAQFFSPWYSFSEAAWKEILLNFSLLKGFSEKYGFSGIPQGWSLSVEEAFYILAPVFFFLVKKNRIWLLILPFGILFLGFGFQSMAFQFSWETFQFSTQYLWINTFFGRIFEFFWGIAFGIWHSKMNLNKQKGFFTWLGTSFLFLSVLGLLALKGNLKYGLYHPAGIFINHFLMPALGILPLFLGLMYEKTWISRWFSTSWMQLLGKSSYVFYLLHIGIAADFFTNVIYLNGLVKFLVLNGLAILVYLKVEKPIHLGIRKFLNPREKF